MKRQKAEQVVVAVVLLALAIMGGFFWGRNSLAGPVRVIVQTPQQPEQNQEAISGGTQTASPEDGAQAAASSESGAQTASPESGTAEENVFPININTATAQELQALPGIGQARAEAIVAYREEHGPFAYVEHLCQVSGIGEGILANIIDYITVGEQNNG